MLIRQRIHNIGINVVWLSLAQDTEDSKGPLIPGQMAHKFPASCDLVLYHNVLRVTKDEVRYDLHTRSFGPFMARSRMGSVLPDPLPAPSYVILEQYLTGQVAA
jgi:hypothetical protein